MSERNKIALAKNKGKISDFDDEDYSAVILRDTDGASEYDLIQAFRAALAPARRVTCDVWADENLELTSDTSAEPGPWRTQRFPFMREILQKLSPTDPAMEIIMAKGVQVSATACGIVAMLTFADTDPCPTMYVMPTITLAEDFSKDKLQPMINSAESLKNKFKDPRTRDSGNTILGKRYPGGFIVLAGANAAASLRSRSIRLLILDEVDAYTRNLEKEGSPIALAQARTVSFGMKKKIFMPSTPTVKGASTIWLHFESTDQRHYHVKCPACSHPQNLVFEQLKWTPGAPHTVVYECIDCGHGIEEGLHKTKMLNEGEWVSHVPERRNDYKIGYHLNSLYSPYGWLSWKEIAEKYEDAQREMTDNQEDNLMRAFVNTICGLPYETKGEQPEWRTLYNRRDQAMLRNSVNEHVKLITAGVDVQKDRIELEIVGWGLGKRAWSIDYRVHSVDEMEAELRRLADLRFVNHEQVALPIHKICIDAGFNTSDIYAICRNLGNQELYVPIHGSSTQKTSILSTPKFANILDKSGNAFAVRYYMLGVDLLKDELYTALKKTKDQDDPLGPPGYCHFPGAYAEHYFQSITAEKKVTDYKDGYAVQKYVKEYQRNEVLDTRNYARAGLALSGYDDYGDLFLETMYATYRQQIEEAPKKAKKRSDFW